MIAAALLLLLGPPQVKPIDWDALPPLPWRAPPQISQTMTDFVLREVHTRKCPLAAPLGATQEMQVDLAVLVTTDNQVRAVVPRAIKCPTVEQYSAGLVTSFARDNLLPRTANADQWYRASITFTWKK